MLTKIEIPLDAKDEIRSPVMIKLTRDIFLWTKNIKIKKTETAPKKDIALIPHSIIVWERPVEAIIQKATNKEEPELTPKISGPANGF